MGVPKMLEELDPNDVDVSHLWWNGKCVMNSLDGQTMPCQTHLTYDDYWGGPDWDEGQIDET